jgi:hypothetical protein
MPIDLTRTDDGIIACTVTGILVQKDYDSFCPRFEGMLQKYKQHGKLRVLFEMKDFHGWDPGALWDEIRFDIKHSKDVERLAMVGEKKWERELAVFTEPFTAAAVRYFDLPDLAAATKWLDEAKATPSAA